MTVRLIPRLMVDKAVFAHAQRRERGGMTENVKCKPLLMSKQPIKRKIKQIRLSLSLFPLF